MSRPMREVDRFERTAFLGLARASKRDPYRLSLFAQHLAAGESVRVLLPVRGGTLLVTDDRLLELYAHLEVHGAWNVKEFQGYAIRRAIERGTVKDVRHDVRIVRDASGERRVEDRVVMVADADPEEFLVSRGPQPTLSKEDVDLLKAAVLSSQAK